MLGSDSAPGDQRPRHRVELAVYSVEWTKAANRHFAESLNAKGLSWYDDGGDARFHRVAGEWVADASAVQSPVVEATWFARRDTARGPTDGSRWRPSAKRRLAVPTIAATRGETRCPFAPASGPSQHRFSLRQLVKHYTRLPDR